MDHQNYEGHTNKWAPHNKQYGHNSTEISECTTNMMLMQFTHTLTHTGHTYIYIYTYAQMCVECEDMARNPSHRRRAIGYKSGELQQQFLLQCNAFSVADVNPTFGRSGDGVVGVSGLFLTRALERRAKLGSVSVLGSCSGRLRERKPIRICPNCASRSCWDGETGFWTRVWGLLAMAELGSVHRYAAGGLFALALSQAQIQPRAPLEHPSVGGSDDHPQPRTPFLDAEEVSWCDPDHGLLRHVFRFSIFSYPSLSLSVHLLF